MAVAQLPDEFKKAREEAGNEKGEQSEENGTE